MENDAIVSGGVSVPEYLINHNLDCLDQSGEFLALGEQGKHISLLLALHKDKLNKNFFELYNYQGQVNVKSIGLLDEKIGSGIINEINEILGIKPFKLTTIRGEV